MQTIVLKPFYHRGEECMGIYFTADAVINEIIRKVAKIKWSQTFRCWYMPCNRESYHLLIQALVGKVLVDATLLKIYLQQRKALVPVQQQNIAPSTATMLIQCPLSEVNLIALKKFRDRLILKGYSSNTIKNYCNEFHQLLRLLGNKHVNDLKKEQILSYLLWLLDKRGCSEMKVHMSVNAIKFYFEKVEGREKG